MGATTILVLEDSDIALSDHYLIGEALAELIEGRTDQPHEIYLVETTANPWTVWHLKRGELIWPDQHYHEFNPAILKDTTSATASNAISGKSSNS